MTYNTGNLEKHITKNPLKRMLVNRLNEHMLSDIGNYISKSNSKVYILDAGCGEGFTDQLLMRNFPEVNITGLEYIDEAIRIARKMNPEVEYVQGDICDMPFEDNWFDIVLCSEVLEHLENPNKAMQEINRISKGLVYITVPHEPWFCLGNLITLKNVRRLGNPIDHINHWSKSGFKRFIDGNKPNGRWTVAQSFPWIIAYRRIGDYHSNV